MTDKLRLGQGVLGPRAPDPSLTSRLVFIPVSTGSAHHLQLLAHLLSCWSRCSGPTGRPGSCPCPLAAAIHLHQVDDGVRGLPRQCPVHWAGPTARPRSQQQGSADLYTVSSSKGQLQTLVPQCCHRLPRLQGCLRLQSCWPLLLLAVLPMALHCQLWPRQLPALPQQLLLLLAPWLWLPALLPQLLLCQCAAGQPSFASATAAQCSAAVRDRARR